MTSISKFVAGRVNSVPAADRAVVRSMSNHVRELASEEFGGRLPGTEGEIRTLDYLRNCFAKYGLEPGADGGKWTQEVPLLTIEPQESLAAHIRMGEKTLELRHGDNAIVSSLSGEQCVVVDNAPIVFVGYGIHAPEYGWDDFKGVSLEGKIALVLINDPDFVSPNPGRFGGKGMTYYGRWEYKFEEVKRRGAMGAFILHEAGPAGYDWKIVTNSLRGVQFSLNTADAASTQLPIRGWLNLETAEQLAAGCGLSLDDLRTQAARTDFRPLLLQRARFSAKAQFRVTSSVSHNVIAKVSGEGREDECVLYGAHWDHLGVAKGEGGHAETYHGAVDNAAAVGSVLELAKAFAVMRPSRSIYFVAFTGEEKGLLGSKYYVAHPPSDLELTAGVITMEFMGATGPAKDLSTWGNVTNGLWDCLAEATSRCERTLTTDRHLGAGYFFRSDHFPFAQHGVPAVTVTSGQDLYDGGEEAGARAYLEYLTQRYHKPADMWSADLDLRGVALDLDALYVAGLSLASSSAWPEWDDTTSYKSVRYQSAHRRNKIS